MDAEGSEETPSVDHAMLQASHILNPTIHENDFLQSFVRIGLDDSCQQESTTRRSGATGISRRTTKNGNTSSKLQTTKICRERESLISSSSGRRSGNEDNARTEKRDGFSRSIGKSRAEHELDARKVIKGRRRQKNVTFRQEEVYTDKDRAAAVNMGSRDIIQSLKLKRQQERNRELQIPDEVEPSAMLALAAREIRSGDVGVAIQCVNKALELSPHDKNALIARSKCYLLLGEPQKALQDAEAALNEKIKDPNNARAMYYKAEALYHLGDFELSLVYYYRGMRIRPEFDQFRLGVQKAKEAIQNILGNSSLPIPNASPARSSSKLESSSSPLGGARELEGPQTFLQPVKEKNNNVSISEEKSFEKISSSAKSEDVLQKPVRSKTAKRKVKPPNLLGQLNVDKKYLEDLLKCPDIKAGHQASAKHILSHAEEGVAFLETRQEFWRQQRPAPRPTSK